MAKLLLKVKGSELKIASPFNVVSTQIKYDTCEFTFNSEWDGYTKTAVFYSDSTEKKNMQIDANSCIIPWENLVNPGVLYIGVFGTKGDSILPTNFITTPITEGAYGEATSSQMPTQDIYTRILNNMAAYSLAEDTRNYAEIIRISNENERQHNTSVAIQNSEYATDRAIKAAQAAEDVVSGIISLPDIGTPGTYTKVTTDSKGRVVEGTSPALIGDLGITNVYTKTEVDTNMSKKIVQTAEISDPTKIHSSVVTANIAAQVSSLSSSVSNLNNNLAMLGTLEAYVICSQIQGTVVYSSMVPLVNANGRAISIVMVQVTAEFTLTAEELALLAVSQYKSGFVIRCFNAALNAKIAGKSIYVKVNVA